MPRKNRIGMLLVETDIETIDVFTRYVRAQFPNLALDVVNTPDHAMQLLRINRYEVVICDAFLALNSRVLLVNRICTESKCKPLLIVISGDTRINVDMFAKDICIQNVIYKPLDASDLTNKIQDAIDTVLNRESK